jgi:predicted O-methyltransferase YrrM
MISSTVVAQRIKVTAEIRQLAPNIGEDTQELLADMYSAKQLVGTARDEPISIHEAKISIAQGAQMNQLIRQSETNHSLEVGFAYGFSTIWILDGLRSRKNSRHVAIDPFETTYWGGVGLHQVKRLNVAPGFEWIDEFSIHALSTLIKRGEKFDFIYIDGNHRFDDVLVDFYLSDQLVSPGGLVLFDDVSMPSVRTVISFILTNRQYNIVPQSVRNLVVLKKVADDSYDNRDWRHFERFIVHGADYPKLKQIILELARATGTDRMLRRIQSRYRGF